MNICYVTPRGQTTYESTEEARAAWHDGKEFRIYVFANIITKADSLRLMMSKFTHVRIVFQRKDFHILHIDIELKESGNGVRNIIVDPLH
jgi:hypothetical protein